MINVGDKVRIKDTYNERELRGEEFFVTTMHRNSQGWYANGDSRGYGIYLNDLEGVKMNFTNGDRLKVTSKDGTIRFDAVMDYYSGNSPVVIAGGSEVVVKDSWNVKKISDPLPTKNGAIIQFSGHIPAVLMKSYDDSLSRWVYLNNSKDELHTVPGKTLERGFKVLFEGVDD